MTLLIPSRSPESSKWHVATGTFVLSTAYTLALIVVRWYVW